MWTCNWCLNTGARPLGKPEKPRRIPQERWDRLYGDAVESEGFKRWNRWTRCQACNANFYDERTGPEIAAALSQDERLDVLESPANRGF